MRGDGALQVPSGVFVFLNDVDFITTPKLHADLTSGRWAAELQRMREAWTSTGKRMALVLPAFERLKATKQASPGGRPAAVPFKGACSAATGCAWLQGMALPRTFDSLRTMMQQGAVDVFHRRSVRALAQAAALARRTAWPCGVSSALLTLRARVR